MAFLNSEIKMLEREADFQANSEISWTELLERVEIEKDRKAVSFDKDKMDGDMEKLLLRLERARDRRLASQQRRIALAKSIHEARQLNDAIAERANRLAFEQNCLQEQSDSMSIESTRIACRLKKMMQMNAINDTFHIWYSGPFGTINGFRLGNLPSRPVEWTEINAALGQAVLAVTVVAAKARVEFKRYHLEPMGSFSKVYRNDDRRNAYSLFTDGSFSLFPKRNFNTAMQGFLYCVQDLGEHISKHDPTLTLPYSINAAEIKIHEQSASLGSDDEVWTRSLKFLLADIKWVVAWWSKHRSE